MKRFSGYPECGPRNERKVLSSRRFAISLSGQPFSADRTPFLAAIVAFGFAACLHVTAATGTESLNAICYRLKTSSSFVERLHAAETLAEFGGRAVPALRGLLQYPDPRVREFAIVALGRLGPEGEPAVPELTAILEIPGDPLVSMCLFALARIGPAATPAVPAIAALLPDLDSHVQREAIRTLASIGTVEAVRALAVALEGDEPDQQRATLDAILQCGPAAGAVLAELVEFGSHTPDISLRDEVFLTIAHIGEPAVADLILLLDVDQAELRRCAALALSQMGLTGRAAVPELQRVLQDPDAAVRFWAARALGDIAPGDSNVQFALWQALSDPDADVRWAAAKSLGLDGIAEAGETRKGAN